MGLGECKTAGESSRRKAFIASRPLTGCQLHVISALMPLKNLTAEVSVHVHSQISHLLIPPFIFQSNHTINHGLPDRVFF